MKIIENFDLTDYNSYKFKATCKKAYFPNSNEDVQIAFSDKAVKRIIIGNGNNLILSADYYEEDFIVFNGNFNAVTVESDVIKAQAGATLKELCEIAYENSLGGMEVFWDIPSSLGGAVVMNAGASGEEIKDILVKVSYLDLNDGEIKERYNEDIGFVYRNSFFQKDESKVVLNVQIQLKKALKETIMEKMNAIRDKRWEKQPRNYPNCGSVFKRPEGRFVGPMLDELGLKGFSIGGAQVSEKHSGFIVNRDNATGKDVLALIKEVQRRVKEKFGVNLEVEQRII
jgi:UDP-N-acetylmuramate dehydrogenase